MSCYKPLIRAEDLTKWETASDGHKYHPAQIFSSDHLEIYDKKYYGKWKHTLIPCGNCIGCRLDYSREWANRGYLESLNNYAYFLTTTYDDAHLHRPLQITTTQDITYTELEENEWKGILVPRDFTNFLKSLRKEMAKDGYKIRFIGCGEYGTKKARPHYHFILYLNKPWPINDLTFEELTENKDMLFSSEIVNKVWKKGLNRISEANWQTIAYVARYITKKQKGEESEDYYASKGQIPEFFRSSRKPGIGYDYYQEHKEEIYKNDKILVKMGDKVKYETPPRYFDKMYEKEFPEDFKIIKLNRQRRALMEARIKDKTTSLSRWEQLQIELAEKEESAMKLRRKIEM